MQSVSILLTSILLLLPDNSEPSLLENMFGSCGSEHYVLQIQTSLPFHGVIFSKTNKGCEAHGNGSTGLILRVDRDCGLRENMEPSFRDQIYVQRDPHLQQAEDELLEIICGSSPSEPASLIRYDGASEPVFYQNLETAFEVNDTKDNSSLEERLNQISNEIDTEKSDIYVQAWMDILTPPGSGEEDSFHVGQNVSLQIKWKNPASLLQPSVGSCTASSAGKSLRLTDEKGRSLQKIFPSHFNYSPSPKSSITTASASFLMFKFAKSDSLVLRCRLRFSPSKVPIVLEATAEGIQEQLGLTDALNAERPSHYLRSDDLSAQEAKQELLEIERDFNEPQVCMSRIRIVLAFGVLILVLFIALVFSCMLWSRARSFTSQLRKPQGGVRLKGRMGPYVLPSAPYR